MLASFNLSTDMPNFLAILYRLSPDTTVYVLVSLALVGILSTWPILRLLVVRLFRFLISSTVVFNFLAILYKLSPGTTV